MNLINIIIEILALIVGVAAGYSYHRYQAEKALKNQHDKADNILKGANEQARLIESQARENATKIVQAAESEIKERRIELNKETDRLDKRRSELDSRVDKLEQRVGGSVIESGKKVNLWNAGACSRPPASWRIPN